MPDFLDKLARRVEDKASRLGGTFSNDASENEAGLRDLVQANWHPLPDRLFHARRRPAIAVASVQVGSLPDQALDALRGTLGSGGVKSAVGGKFGRRGRRLGRGCAPNRDEAPDHRGERQSIEHDPTPFKATASGTSRAEDRRRSKNAAGSGPTSTAGRIPRGDGPRRALSS